MTSEKTLGILGGGQLGQLLSEAARQLDIFTIVLSPDADAPARSSCDEFIHAGYLDQAALSRLAESCDVVTLENEHIPLETLIFLETRCALRPGLNALSRIRDRLSQRGLLMRLQLPQTRFWSIDKPVSVQAARRSAEFPAVLKRRHGGYDGHGQVHVAEPDALFDAWESLQRAPCVLEPWLDGLREFSIVGANGEPGCAKLYRAIDNQHSQGQLQHSLAPASVPQAMEIEAQQAWRRIAGALKLRGVMAVEFFRTPSDQWLVNEIVPQVHNSGHVTQMAYKHSQFEMHVRAVMGLPLPPLYQIRRAAMLNLYPEHGILDQSAAQRAQSTIGGQIYLYGKTPRPRRKLGHWLVPTPLHEQARVLLDGATAGGATTADAA